MSQFLMNPRGFTSGGWLHVAGIPLELTTSIRRTCPFLSSSTLRGIVADVAVPGTGAEESWPGAGTGTSKPDLLRASEVDRAASAP
jgi:hypothetical protein